jgi:hypothetical protein
MHGHRRTRGINQDHIHHVMEQGQVLLTKKVIRVFHADLPPPAEKVPLQQQRVDSHTTCERRDEKEENTAPGKRARGRPCARGQEGAHPRIIPADLSTATPFA